MRRIPQAVIDWLRENNYGSLQSIDPVGGGCINNGARLITETGVSFFLKTNTQAPEDMFAREAEGLRELGETKCRKLHISLSIPEPLIYGSKFLLLEDLKPSPRNRDYWLAFGRGLARLHLCTCESFGFYHDNYIGSTPQKNAWSQNGWEFFTQQRLLYQADIAIRRGLLPQEAIRRVERLGEHLPELVPEQPASLLHGDLWAGNATTNSEGGPAIIDPAAYYGWAEADLAMTDLFGAFPNNFYRAYEEIRSLEPGYRERYPLYNLYHLLNHLNLFGSGYRGQVISILNRYT